MANKDIIPDAVTSVDVMQVIRTVAMRGAGTPNDPFRNITQFWTMDGLLIKETDIQMEANKDIIPDAVTSVDVIQVIRTVAMRGAGTPNDPFRNITQFWTMDGFLIKETDIQMEANKIARDYGQRSANLREMMK
jgi:hypothetical protein